MARGQQLAALFAASLALVPPTAAAQQFEFSVFGGGYLPLAREQTTGSIIDCSQDPCPYFYRHITRSPAPAFGVRVGGQVNSRLGVEAVVQRVSATHHVSPDGNWSSSPEQVTHTFLALQPRWRLHVDDRVQGFISAGPFVAITDATGTRSGTEGTQSGVAPGLAVGAALRLPLARSLDLELRATDYLYRAHAPAAQLQNDLIYGIAIGLRSGDMVDEPLGQGPSWLARAAARTTVSPAVGGYFSLGNRPQWTVSDAQSGPTNGQSHRMTLEPAVSFGFRAAVQSFSWWGVEASFVTAGVTRRDDASKSPTAVYADPPPEPLQRALGRNSIGALRFTALARVNSWADVTVGAGPALVVITRDFLTWDRYRRLVDDHIWGASVGAMLGLSPTGATRFELGVSDHIYALQFEAFHPRLGQTQFVQHDFVITAGFAIKTGQR